MKSSVYNRLPKPLTFWEIALFLASVFFLFISFQQGDILHTGGSSFTYLNGHIRDFYEANFKALGITNYLPSTYIIFALWNLPIKLLGIVNMATTDVGFVVFWYKLLTTLFLVWSAYFLYKIGLVIGLDKSKSVLLTVFWISSPILIFSQFIFGQYDILTVFFVLIGIYYYLKGHNGLFIAFFAISLTFKYFPLFIFVPLLLLVEKKPLKVLLNMFLVTIPFALEVLFYYRSPIFREGVFGFGANQRILTTGFNIEYNLTLSIFVVIWFFLCGITYWMQTKNRTEFIKWSLYIMLFVPSILFSLIFWHPQWLLFVTPFLAITTFTHKKAKFFVLLDLVMMYFFIGFTVNNWVSHVDQALWGLGLFGKLNPMIDPSAVLLMKDFFIPNNTSLYYSLFASTLLLNIVLKYPGLQSTNFLEYPLNSLSITKNWGLVRARFLIGTMIFVIPATVCFMVSFNYGKKIYSVNSGTEQAQPVPEIVRGTRLGQVFKADSKEINVIKVQMATYMRTNTSNLKFTLAEYGKNEMDSNVLFSKDIKAESITDNYYYKIDVGGVHVKQDKFYVFYFESDAVPGNGVTIYHTPNNEQSDRTFAVINDVRQDFNLHFMIYGER